MLLIPAIILTLLCLWVVIPPFNTATIVLAVGSIELSPYLLVVNVLLLACTQWKDGRFRFAASTVLAINCVLCALPLLALVRTDVSAVRLNGGAPVAITQRVIPIALGRERSYILAYLPEASQPVPAIFAIYGGAWRSGSPRSDAWLNTALAHHGYAVFALDYRHAPKYHFPAALDDVRSEIAFICKNARRYNIDPERTALLGHSSGGELAELMAFEPGSHVRALISYSGAVDLTMGWKYPPSPDPIGIRAVIQNYIGDTPARAPERYRAATPLDHIRRGLPPILLIYAMRDDVVDFRYAQKFRDSLRGAGAHVTFLQLPWTEHAFEDVPFGLHAPIAYRATLRFLSAVLPAANAK